MTAAPPPSAAAAYIFDVNEATFQQDVLQRSMAMPVLVAFSSQGSPTSRALMSVLEEVTREVDGIFALARLNIDKNPYLAQQLQIQSLPHVKLLSQGRVAGEFSGAKTREQVREWLKGFFGEDLPEAPTDPIAEGEAALQAGDTGAAIVAFNAHQQQHPGSPKSLLPLARLALGQQDKATARALLSNLPSEGLSPGERAEASGLQFMLELEPPEGDEGALREAIRTNPLDHASRHDLAMLYASRGEMDEALSALLEIVIRDRDWEEDKARQTMVQLFEVMGLNAPETRSWQKRLGRAMY